VVTADDGGAARLGDLLASAGAAAAAQK